MEQPIRDAPDTMKATVPSRTAHFVALGRALADAGLSHIPDFHDRTARVFLNAKGKKSLAKTEEAARGKGGIKIEMARAMADMIGLRTVAIDAAVRQAIANVDPSHLLNDVRPLILLALVVEALNEVHLELVLSSCARRTGGAHTEIRRSDGHAHTRAAS